jgi:predicted nucleic acid-binding protein
VETFADLSQQGARFSSSIPVVLETFTFLERNISKDIALQWRETFSMVPRFRLWECTKTDLAKSWEYFERRDLHKLSAVDATSFAVMKRENIKTAFTFDAHFAAVGFKVVG